MTSAHGIRCSVRQRTDGAALACYTRVFVDVTVRSQLELTHSRWGFLPTIVSIQSHAAGCSTSELQQPEAKPMPDTRNTQHPQQRPFSGAQRPRRHVQPAPQSYQTEDGLTNLQSVLVHTAPCFPASNQVTPLVAGTLSNSVGWSLPYTFTVPCTCLT